MLISLLVVGFMTVIIRWILNKRQLEKRLPPGPKGHFLMGNGPAFSTNRPLEQLEKWKQEFGDIFRLYLAGNLVVVVSSEEAVKDVLFRKDSDFAGRGTSFRTHACNNFSDFIGFSDDSPHWRNMKKGFMTSLKMYGDNLLVLESLALESVKGFVDTVRQLQGTAFNPEPHLIKLISEIIAQLVMADNFDESFIQEFIDYERKVLPYFLPIGPGRELETFPWLRHLGNKHWAIIKEAADFDMEYFSGLISNRKRVFDLKDPKCLIDALYKQYEEEKAKYGETKLNETDIQMIVTEAIRGGISSTFKALLCFLAIVTAYPEVQKRLQNEIDDVTEGREPRLEDKSSMHYTEATILELLRYISHVPLLVPHKAMKDSSLEGYFIPKDAQIWVNAHSFHHDERYWEEPWTFKPERFLDEDGQLVKAGHQNRRRLVAFGSGKRICPAEVLAKNRMFLFLSSLMQNFSFRAAEGEDKPDHDPREYRPTLVMAPKPYKKYVLITEKNDGLLHFHS